MRTCSSYRNPRGCTYHAALQVPFLPCEQSVGFRCPITEAVLRGETIRKTFRAPSITYLEKPAGQMLCFD